MDMKDINKINDILEKIDCISFFNQRAGRELWNDKPTDIQNKDIEYREKALNDITDYINELFDKVKELEEENKILKDEVNNLINQFNTINNLDVLKILGYVDYDEYIKHNKYKYMES